MRSYALLNRAEEIDVWETSKEPLKLLPEYGDYAYIGYSDLDWPFNVTDPENWKCWEGTEQIWGWFNPDTKDFMTDKELDEKFDGYIPEGYDEYCKCQDYKNGEPIGEVYYE